MVFNQLVLPSSNRFSLKVTMVYLAACFSLIILGLQCNFLTRIVPVSREAWMMIHTLVTLLVMTTSIEILLNLFFWRNQVATYTLYLGPVLLIGNIFDNLHFAATPSIYQQPALSQLDFKSNLWIWLFGRFIFSLGLLMSGVIFCGKSKFKRMNPFIYLGIVFSFAVTLISAFLYFNKLLPPQHKTQIFTLINDTTTFAPTILMILVAEYLRQYSLEKDLFIYDAKTIESGKRAFINGVNFLVFSELFFWLGILPNDWASLFGYLSKLIALWFFMISFWRAFMTRSLMQINLTVKSLIEAIEAHETFTSGHSKRVAIFARIIGKWYGMSHKNLDRLGLAGTLHDTGKLSIPKEILQKKGPLNESEWAIVRRHPQEGAKIIAPLKLNWCEQAILQHHERPDGTGYPRRLSGVESIDLFARIIAVADTFDAITSDRHYRFAGNFAQAQEIILRESGKQFDPKCVNAFMKAFPELIEFRRDKLKSTLF